MDPAKAPADPARAEEVEDLRTGRIDDRPRPAIPSDSPGSATWYLVPSPMA